MDFSFRQWFMQFFQPRRGEKIDLKRRSLIAATITGSMGGLLFKTQPLSKGRSYSPSLVRPPGSVTEEEFLARCIRCGECMKICPTNGIQPALLEGGWEGIWTPVMNMVLGYCEYECTLCTQVCPSDAIRELVVEEKKKTKIGLAFFDINRCLPYAYQRTCIVCEEHCPTPKKAIWFEEKEVLRLDGSRVMVKQPHVDPDLCIGCGICTNKCVVEDQPAILVYSVGETRNPKNQILLPSGNPAEAGGIY